jgi:hypothetical protein
MPSASFAESLGQYRRLSIKEYNLAIYRLWESFDNSCNLLQVVGTVTNIDTNGNASERTILFPL